MKRAGPAPPVPGAGTGFAADQERRLSDALLETLPGVYYMYGDDLVLKRWNRNFERVTGYSAEELRQMSPLDLFDERDRQRVAERIQDVFRNGFADVEADFMRRDGSRIPYYFTGVRTELDGVAYLVGVGIDLTELRETQQRLVASEQRLREIFEAVNVGIGVAGPDDRFLEVNQGLCSILGHTREELLRLHTYDIVHPDDRTESRRITSDVHAGRLDTHLAERRYLRRDGSTIWVNVFSRSMFDESGRERYSVGVIFDVTERRLAEAALEESERRYQLANRATFNVIWDWDLQTNQVWWNETFQTLFGYDVGEIEPGIESWTTRIHPDDLERVSAGIHAAIDSGRDTWRDEYRFRRRDGSYADVEDRGYIAHDEAGRPVRMIGAMQDITERKRAAETLKLFRTLVDRANDSIEVIDPDSGRFLDVNNTFCQVLGYTREEVLTKTVADLDPTLDPADWPQRVRALRKAGTLVAEGWHRRKDGRMFPVEVSVALVHLDRDYIVASVRDISERRQAEQSIRRLNRIHAVLSGINSLIVRERDRGQLYQGACRIAVEKGEFTCAWIGTLAADGAYITPVAVASAGESIRLAAARIPLVSGVLPDDDILVASVHRQEPVAAPSLTDGTAAHLSILGWHERPFQTGISLPMFAHGRCLGAMVLYAAEGREFDAAELALLTELAEDISFALEFMDSQEQIRHMAYHDALTGLANRAYLMSRLKETLEHARRGDHACGLLLVNLNNFQSINNSLGHTNGDSLLRQVAGRLRGTLWNNDVVACLGGDEFAILLPRLASPEDVDLVIHKLNTSLQEPFDVADLPLEVEARIGYALFPAHADSAERLWQRASVALHAARERHRPALEYASDIDRFDPQNLSLLSGLRGAIECGELTLHYQPKVDLHSMKVTGAEALVRWQHPQKGLIFPDRFIPLAEQTVLIAPLTRSVLGAAMTQGSAWLRQGLDLDLAINLSARNIHDPNLYQDIMELASRADFPLQRLILEITESAIMDDPDQGRELLARLGNSGIGISMDDFGIGQSSLAYLKDLPITRVKIDKSFVMGMNHGRNATIVRAAIELAHSLGMKVTAEGIEDEAALAQLRAWNCDTGQGYYFSKPLPPERLVHWLRETGRGQGS